MGNQTGKRNKLNNDPPKCNKLNNDPPKRIKPEGECPHPDCFTESYYGVDGPCEKHSCPITGCKNIRTSLESLYCDDHKCQILGCNKNKWLYDGTYIRIPLSKIKISKDQLYCNNCDYHRCRCIYSIYISADDSYIFDNYCEDSTPNGQTHCKKHTCVFKGCDKYAGIKWCKKHICHICGDNPVIDKKYYLQTCKSCYKPCMKDGCRNNSSNCREHKKE
jgi:hypothetical protein